MASPLPSQTGISSLPSQTGISSPTRADQRVKVPLGFFCSFLKIFAFSVNAPDIVFGLDSAGYIIYRNHGCEHGMILIVVFVHSIATNKKKILELIDILPELIKPIVGAKVSRICFRHPYDCRIEHRRLINNSNLVQFVSAQRRHLFVRPTP
jgi:hypothetical protein